MFSTPSVNFGMLQFMVTGIDRSAGRGVQFERDLRGPAVTDPAGKRIEHRYNARGDLVAVTNRLGAVTPDPTAYTTRLTYRTHREHYLDTIFGILRA